MNVSNKHYEVERVVGKRIQKGRVLYLIKWKNYGEEDNTWELEEHCKKAKDAILEYEGMANETDSMPKQNEQQNLRKRSKKDPNKSSFSLDVPQNQGKSSGKRSTKRLNRVQERIEVRNETVVERNQSEDVSEQEEVNRNKKLKTKK